MSDLLEQDLREAFAERAARINPEARARLRAVDYHPRARWPASRRALTMVDGPIGVGVTGVTITRSGESSVRATVKNGWYLAWWPGTARAVTARVASASGTSTQSFPRARQSAPPCPTGGHCTSGYGFGRGLRPRSRSGSRQPPIPTMTIAGPQN